jgi:pimeloyl-ACP methyl ester carboxylesterase
MSDPILRAGTGAAPIVFPPETFPADGIMGVHDDPYFRVLVLEKGERVALCSAELVNIPDDGIALAKRIVGQVTGTREENVWVHMTHAITTPHAPYDPEKGGMPPAPGKSDPDSPKKRAHYIQALETAVQQAAEQAAVLSQAVLSLGKGESRVNVNRDVETPKGWWIGHDPEGPSNKMATVLRLDKIGGGLIGVLVSYGLKPCAIDNSEMETGKRLVSSDVPGLAMRVLEKELGAPCLFFMSAAGDQVPREQAWYDAVDANGDVYTVDNGVQAGLEIVERLGREFADDLRGIIGAAQAVDAAQIGLGGTSVTWQTKGRIKMAPRRSVTYEASGEQTITADMITLGDIALIAAKPEINTATERELQTASPYGTTLLMTMVNGGMKYMPDASSYDRVTWESQSAMLMPGAAEAWVEKTAAALTEMKNGLTLPTVTAVAEARPDGERITQAIVTFDKAPTNVLQLGVRGRTVASRFVQDNVATLILSEEDENSYVIPKPKHRPGGPGGPGRPGGRPIIPERRRDPISVAVTLPGTALEARSTKVLEPVIDDFTQGQYKSMLYNLYVPENRAAGEKYPLVLFIPDASANGGDPLLALSQGTGATVWADPQWQAEHPCYVLAIQVPKAIHLVNDGNRAAPELEDIVELLRQVMAENDVDVDRVYTTGQSQGCMASCELNLRYPDLFAASLLVSGQWDLERMSTLTDRKFFIGLSEGGPREYPFMQQWTQRLRSAGVDVQELRLSFRDGFAVNEEKVRAVGDAQVVYVVWEAATIFPDDGTEHPQIDHHNRGWELTYQLKSAQEWLFRQKR